jgi:hypothetical protein
MSIYSKLLTFRETISAVKKDADNPFYKSKYADLPSILEAIKTPLKESGLAITHFCINSNWEYVMKTILADTESDEKIESEFPIFWTKPQEIGSSMSYARRYNLLAILDIPTEDDDGNSANEAPKTTSKYTGWQDKKWLNFKDLQKAINWWTDTEILLTEWIKDNEFSLSTAMKTCLRTYCDTGVLTEPEWKK